MSILQIVTSITIRMAFTGCQTCGRGVATGLWYACQQCGKVRHHTCARSCKCRCDEWHMNGRKSLRCIASSCRTPPLGNALCGPCQERLKTIVNKRTLSAPEGISQGTLNRAVLPFFANIGFCRALSEISTEAFTDAVKNANVLIRGDLLLHKYHALVREILKRDMPIEIPTQALSITSNELKPILEDARSVTQFKSFIRDFATRLNICITRQSNTHICICPASAYNIHDIGTLEVRLRSAGHRGIRLKDILSEYDDAWPDICKLQEDGLAWTADFCGVFHSSALVKKDVKLSERILKNLNECQRS